VTEENIMEHQITESMQVEPGSKLYETIWRGFKYDKESSRWYYSKQTKERLDRHSFRCFRHAHYLFEKNLYTIGIKWPEWRIKIGGGGCTVGEFQNKQVKFFMIKITKE
jgi:hypothetical protein